jgi:hypothetical protein
MQFILSPIKPRNVATHALAEHCGVWQIRTYTELQAITQQFVGRYIDRIVERKSGAITRFEDI